MQVLLDREQHHNAFSISGSRNSEPSQTLSVITQPSLVCAGGLHSIRTPPSASSRTALKIQTETQRSFTDAGLLYKSQKELQLNMLLG